MPKVIKNVVNTTKTAKTAKPAAKPAKKADETIVVLGEYKGLPMFGIHLADRYDEDEPMKSSVINMGPRKALAIKKHLDEFLAYCAEQEA
jgi:hypothetical protein